MSNEQMAVMDELALEISSCDDSDKKAELERTQRVCHEIAYGLAEGMIEVEEDEDGELHFYPSA